MYRSEHAFSQTDLFHGFDSKKLEFKDGAGTAREMKKKYKYNCKLAIIPKIFMAFMKLVFKDIAHGTTFHLPTKSIAMFTWCSLTGEKFVKAYQSGKFDKIDFLSSNFTLYLPIFKYFYRGKFRESRIVLDKEYHDVVSEKVNNGYKYC